MGHFYPRTPCGVRRWVQIPPSAPNKISIHVPRAGYDAIRDGRFSFTASFLSTYPVRGTTRATGAGRLHHSISIHVPRAGYDTIDQNIIDCWKKISIHVPRAGYDMEQMFDCESYCHFYPRTPCGVRRDGNNHYIPNVGISIHVPRAGYDWLGTTSTKNG